MNRSSMILLLGSLLSMPAFAQQPIQPSEQYGQTAPPPQMMPQPQSQPPRFNQQPMDPYAVDPNAVDEDDEEVGYDVTYDVSTDPQDQYDDGYDANAYQQFQSQLAPYGSWQDVPNYGEVWVPNPSEVGGDFEPYATNGNWVDSDYGWTWVSDYDWGWAPFHYGRWMVVGGYGWCWMPGTVWGPAWVNWRWGNGYVGWAPMAPHGIVVGPPRGVRGPWRFTVAAQLGARNPAFLPARVVPSVWSRTAIVSNARSISVGGTSVRISAGPTSAQVAAVIGHPVATVALANAAPRALPRGTIAPRVGTPMGARPWLQARPAGGVGRPVSTPVNTRPLNSRPITGTTTPYGRPIGPTAVNAPSATIAPRPVAYTGTYQGGYHSTYSQPAAYHAPVYNSSYHPTYSAPSYHAPAYSAPAAYHPTYSAPTYSAPAYHAPSYSAPSYSAPAPSYHAPSYSAPAASSFHGGGSFGGGGGHHR